MQSGNLAFARHLVMSFGWYVLSYMFWYPAPNKGGDDYSVATMQRVMSDRVNPKTNQPWTPEELGAEGGEWTDLGRIDLDTSIVRCPELARLA